MKDRCNLFIILLVLLASPVFALEKPTHETLNEHIVFNSNLDTYLKNNIGLSAGILSKVNDKRIWEWVREGGKEEDEPLYTRSLNHFHDPLKTWDIAGFKSINQSSIIWSQDQGFFGSLWGGNFSWKAAREYFYIALTGRDFSSTLIAYTQGEKEKYFGKTFRGIGQVMHLVEDASVPAHTRDDAHVVGYHYENAVDKLRANNDPVFTYAIANPITFDSSILTLPTNTLAPIPIAKIFDTDKYNNPSPDPNVTYNSAIGLSEFTNANFFSGDTIFEGYPHPAEENTTAQLVEQYAKDGKLDETWYIQGYTSQKLAAYSYFNKWLSSDKWEYHLDDFVYSDYASQLIPRAVGYSAGLLDYFFRGNIEITLSDSGIYSGIDTQTENPNEGFKKITLLAKNTTPNNEEMNDGSIELVVKYRLALEDPFINYLPDYPFQVEDEFSYIVVPELNNTNDIPRDNPVELTFDLSGSPIPLWAIDVYLQVVYKGTLGNESNAVAVGFKDISEPTPVDFFNDADKICLNNNPNLYTAGSPEAIAEVDTNQNEIADEWDVYAHDVRDIYNRFSPEGVQRYASPSDYNYYINSTIAPEDPQRFMRALYILTDYIHNYNVYNSWIKKDPNDPWGHLPGASEIWLGKAIKNQTDYTDNEGYIWWYPTFLEYRGYLIWWGGGIMFINNAYPLGSECSCYGAIIRTCPEEGASSSQTGIFSLKSALTQEGPSRMQSPFDFPEGISGTMPSVSP